MDEDPGDVFTYEPVEVVDTPNPVWAPIAALLWVLFYTALGCAIPLVFYVWRTL